MTQHQKIVDMCKDGNWHCGNEFRALFIFSPHKRRSEIASKGKYYFEDRKCEHHHAGVRDYRMIPVVTTPKFDPHFAITSFKQASML